MSDTAVITGANRGIGLALTKCYLAKKYNVIATCRDLQLADDLSRLQAMYPEQLNVKVLDVSNKNSIESFALLLTEEDSAIRLVINNAGYLDQDNSSIENIDFDSAKQALMVNSLGPLYLTHKLLRCMHKDGAKIIMISSDMGSFSVAQSAAWYGYRMSKAAVNMLVENLSKELKSESHTVFAIHPGWVKTDMGGGGAAITVSESSAGIVDTIDNLCKQQCGGYFDFTGKVMDF